MGKSSDSKRSRKPGPPPQRQGKGGADASSREADARQVEFLPPLKPRPRLLIALSAVFAVWLGVLLVLRFTAVAGHGRELHPHDEPAQRQPVEGTVPRSSTP